MDKIETEEEKKKKFKENLCFVGALMLFASVVGYSLLLDAQEPPVEKSNTNHAMLFETSACPHCQKLIKETLSNGIIWEKLMGMNLTIMTSATSVKEVEEEWPQFRGLHIYTTKDEVLPYLDMFEIKGVPTLVIVTGNEGGRLLYDKYEGYMNETELLGILNRY